MQMQVFAVFTTSQPADKAGPAVTALCRQFRLTQGQPLSERASSCFGYQAAPPPDCAAETLRTIAAAEKIDVNLIAADDRKKKLLIADMDATVIRGESLDELAALAGIGPQISAITARAMAGELDFEEALTARLQLLRGCPASLLDKVVASTRITAGAKELVATMRRHGAACYLISGGFTFLTSAISQQLGFNGHHANHLETDGTVLAGSVRAPILGRQAKLDYLHDYCGQLGISTAQAAAIGDGANDMQMLQAAGMGIAFEGKPALRAAIPLQLNYSDLSAALYLQGYHASIFAR